MEQVEGGSGMVTRQLEVPKTLIRRCAPWLESLKHQRLIRSDEIPANHRCQPVGLSVLIEAAINSLPNKIGLMRNQVLHMAK